MKSARKIGIGISTCLILVTVATYIMRTREQYVISSLMLKISKGMQLRQIIVACILFLIGYIIVTGFTNELNVWKKIALSYIVGILSWTVMSVLVLCIGIPYNLYSMAIGNAILVIGLSILKRLNLKREIPYLFQDLFIFLGIASIASAGILFVFSSGDSQYYIQEWGKGLAIIGKLDKVQETFLAHTSILPATISSLGYFVGTDNIYCLHWCFVLCWYILIADVFFTIIPKGKKSIKVGIAIGTTILFYLLPPIHLLSGWIIANTYLMICISIFCYLFNVYIQRDKITFGESVILYILTGAITLMRSDSPITMCVILACFAICYPDYRKKLGRYAGFSFICYGIYCIKIGWGIGVDFEERMINPSTMLMMCMLYVIVFLAILLPKAWIDKLKLPALLYVGILLFNVCLLIVFGEVYVNNIATILKNMILVSEHWGATLGIIGLCIVMNLVQKKCNNAFFVIWFSLTIAYIDLGVLRTLDGVSPAARLGFGDSMNRALISVLPILFCSLLQEWRKE